MMSIGTSALIQAARTGQNVNLKLATRCQMKAAGEGAADAEPAARIGAARKGQTTASRKRALPITTGLSHNMAASAYRPAASTRQPQASRLDKTVRPSALSAGMASRAE